MLELWTRKGVMGDEDENDMEDMSGWEESGVWLAGMRLENPVSVLLATGLGLVSAVSGMLNWLAHDIL